MRRRAMKAEHFLAMSVGILAEMGITFDDIINEIQSNPDAPPDEHLANLLHKEESDEA
jgi:hypothetical protein